MGFVVGSGPGAPKVLIFDVLRRGDGLPQCFLGLPDQHFNTVQGMDVSGWGEDEGECLYFAVTKSSIDSGTGSPPSL